MVFSFQKNSFEKFILLKIRHYKKFLNKSHSFNPMLGYRQENNDVYIFFENDKEIKRLEREQIQGVWFNLSDSSKTGLLEALVNDHIGDRIRTSTRKNEQEIIEWFLIEMRFREYESFIEKGDYELHEGFRHICLRNASQVDRWSSFDQMNYRQLKYWEVKISQEKK